MLGVLGIPVTTSISFPLEIISMGAPELCVGGPASCSTMQAHMQKLLASAEQNVFPFLLHSRHQEL
jgi:hypothetical protein